MQPRRAGDGDAGAALNRVRHIVAQAIVVARDDGQAVDRHQGREDAPEHRQLGGPAAVGQIPRHHDVVRFSGQGRVTNGDGPAFDLRTLAEVQVRDVDQSSHGIFLHAQES